MSENNIDQEIQDLDTSVTNGIRSALGVGGLVALIIGILILFWPSKSAAFVAGIIALYAGIAGIVNIAIGIFSRKIKGWARVGYLALGAVFLIVAILAFSNLTATAQALAALLGIIIGIAWIVEGVVTLSTLGDAASKGWAIFYAAVSIVAGVVLLTSPMWGVAILWLLIGLSLVILGIVQLVRAFRFGQK